MENLILLLASAFLFRRLESTPKKIAVSSCGRSAVLPSIPTTHYLHDDNGNPVYVGHAKYGDAYYGFATVELAHTLKTRSDAEEALFLFMEDMHPSFDIEHTAGFVHGYSHPNSDAVWGMTEYWQDRKGKDWKVKAWTDGKVMTVLYVKGINGASVDNQETFLNSFQFSPFQKLVQ